MRDPGRVPTNPDVRVVSRLYPTEDGFAQQAETAVILPSEVIKERLYENGDRAFSNVISGTTSTMEAVCAFGREVVALQGYDASEADLPDGCTLDTEDNGG